MKNKLLWPFVCVLVACGPVLAIDQPGVSPGPGVRYATDAYPGFDAEDEMIKPEKKTPRLLSWFFGPKMDNARDQFRWAESCAMEGRVSKAEGAYDALVRAWPSAPEAAIAQERLADLYFKEDDAISAFEEYRYLLDFYSFKCDYAKIAATMYVVAERMRELGKTWMFFHFANTVDVRRAYESLVLRAPGEPFVPQAMLTIAQLREDEGYYDKAVTVFENLRNLYPTTPEAKTALYREAEARLELVREYGYNRVRIRETINFLKMAIREDVTLEMRNDFIAWLEEAKKALDNAVYASDRFYDSRTRTRRSAINAYRMYLEEYPNGAHAEEAKARLAELLAPSEKEGETPAAPEETPAAPEETAAAPAVKTDKPVNRGAYVQHEPTEAGEPEWLREYAAQRGIKLIEHEPEAGRRPDWLADHLKKKDE